MIKIENVEIAGWGVAVRGMHNSLSSLEKSDSKTCANCKGCLPGQECERYMNGTFIGPNDLDLMIRLRNAGANRRNFMRMITVCLDITAPLYWWKEFKTCRGGRKFGDNEPSIIDEKYFEHGIAFKEFTLDDFSHEYLFSTAKKNLESTIDILNGYREQYCVDTNPEVKKGYWWQMVQLLPSSYNQRRTVLLNYKVLANIYKNCKNNELDEWHTFCDWIERLPYSELITGKENTDK